MIDLENIAAAERGEHTKDGKEKSKNHPQGLETTLGETTAEVIHRTTVHATFGIKNPVFHTESTFGELRGHAEEAAEEKPKGNAWSTAMNPDCHASDVAKTDGARNCGAECLEMRHLTRISGEAVFSTHGACGEAKSADVDECKYNGENKPCCGKPEDHKQGIKLADFHGCENGVYKGSSDITKPLVDFFIETWFGKFLRDFLSEGCKSSEKKHHDPEEPAKRRTLLCVMHTHANCQNFPYPTSTKHSQAKELIA